MVSAPRFTILMPCPARRDRLCHRSVLRQTVRISSCGGRRRGADDTRAAVGRFTDPRIRFFDLPKGRVRLRQPQRRAARGAGHARDDGVGRRPDAARPSRTDGRGLRGSFGHAGPWTIAVDLVGRYCRARSHQPVAPGREAAFPQAQLARGRRAGLPARGVRPARSVARTRDACRRLVDVEGHRRAPFVRQRRGRARHRALHSRRRGGIAATGGRRASGPG